MKERLYHIAKRIDIGGRDYQQDFAGLVDTPNGSILLVADGMGGHEGGEIAAEIAVRTLINNFKENDHSEPSLIIKDSILKAHYNILKTAQENKLLLGMGTTIAVLYLSERYAQAFHVGDSRIYWIRNSNILYRSDDDSTVYKQYLSNKISLDEARTHPQSNLLDQALGASSDFTINESPILNYQKDDKFLICSDGLWGSTKEDNIINIINGDNILDDTVNNLVNVANNAGLITGGKHDNITAILIRTMYNSEAIKKSKILTNVIWLLFLVLISLSSFVMYKVKTNKITELSDTIDSLNIFITNSIHLSKNDSFNYINILPKPKSDSISSLKTENKKDRTLVQRIANFFSIKNQPKLETLLPTPIDSNQLRAKRETSVIQMLPQPPLKVDKL